MVERLFVKNDSLANLIVLGLLILIIGPAASARFTEKVVKIASKNPEYRSLQQGSFVILGLTLEIDRGNLFMFSLSGSNQISRIVALEGDTVEVRDGALYVNGEKLVENLRSAIAQSFRVPKRYIFRFPDYVGQYTVESLNAGEYLMKERDVVSTVVTVLPEESQNVAFDGVKLGALFLIYFAALIYIHVARSRINRVIFHVARVTLVLWIALFLLTIITMFDRAMMFYYLFTAWLGVLGLTIRESNYAVLAITVLSIWLSIVGLRSNRSEWSAWR